MYFFVLDTDLNLIAHFNTAIVGRNMKGKPDVKGKLYRDEFLSVAKKDRSGWIDYYFENPKNKKIEHKDTFVNLAKGSDGKKYLVCRSIFLLLWPSHIITSNLSQNSFYLSKVS